MERKPLHPYQQGGVPEGASRSGSDNISEKIASKFIKGKQEESTAQSSIHADSAEAAQKRALEAQKKAESKAKSKVSVNESASSKSERVILPTEHKSKHTTKATENIHPKRTDETRSSHNGNSQPRHTERGTIHPIEEKKTRTSSSRSMDGSRASSPSRRDSLSPGTRLPGPNGAIVAGPDGKLPSKTRLNVDPEGSAMDGKYKANIYTYDKLRQQAAEKKKDKEQESAPEFGLGDRVKNRNHLANPLAALGHLAVGAVVHPTTAYETHQKVSRYSQATKGVAIGALDVVGGIANRTAFRKDLKLGRIKNQLSKAGMDTKILQKQSVFKNKNGKNKKKLSRKELKFLERSLVTAFREGTLHSADLSKMSDRELNKNIRNLSGKNKAIAKAYREVRRASRVTPSKFGRMKSLVKGGRARQSLTSLVTAVLYQTEVGQGIRLIQRYVRTAKSSIAFAAKVGRLGNTIAKRIVVPYGKLNRAITRKKIEWSDKRTHKKQARRAKRMNKRTERIKSIRRKTITPAKRRIKTTKVGRKVRTVRVRVHYSKPAKTLRSAKKKLKPIVNKGSKAMGFLSKGIGKLANLAKALTNLDETLKQLLFTAVGAGLVIIAIPVLGAAVVVSALNLLPTSSTSEKYNSKPAIEVVADKIKEKDEEWFQKLQKASDDLTAEEANGGEKVYGGDNPLTGKRVELSIDKDTTMTYKFYNGFEFDNLHHGKQDGNEKFDKNKLKDEHCITPYSNLQTIACAGNVYRVNTGCNEDEYVEYCMQLYDVTHFYTTGVSDPHFCSAGNCTKATVQCSDTNTLNQIKKSHTAQYYEDKEKNKNCTYAYLVKNLEKNNNGGKGCTSYYCTEESKLPNQKKCKPVEYTGEDGKGFMTYCDFIQSCENKKQITYKGIPGVDEKAFKKDHNGDGKPDGYYVDEADPSFQYSTDLTNGTILKNSVPGADYEDCSHAKNIITSGVTGEKAKTALDSGTITPTNGTRKYKEKDYYLGYCSDLAAITTGENAALSAGKNTATSIEKKSKMDAYFLLTRKKNAKGKNVYSIATDENTGNSMYFIACQGHKVKKRTFYYCQGKHYGCAGHEIAYCPGHVSLEVYARISGFEGEEAGNKVENNILSADNFYLKNGTNETYHKKWKGFKNSDCSWVKTMLSLDWKQNYNIDPEKYEADAMKKLSS